MKSNLILIAIIFICLGSTSCMFRDKGESLGHVKEALAHVQFKYDTIAGIGHEIGVTRRDPSDIIKVGEICYVYYTKVFGRSPGYWGTIFCASSSDNGYTWEERGEVLGIGTRGTFDSQAVFTPNILCADGKYYLYYTGVRPTPGRTDGVFENNSENDFTAIGLADSNSPDGPFERGSSAPILEVAPDPNAFDSYRIDDAALLVQDGKYWLYFKGRSLSDGSDGPLHTQMGVAFSDHPEGPYIKYNENPILDKSHEVMIWRQGKGVACLASLSATIEYAKDGLDFTTAPLGIAVKESNRPMAPGAYRPDLVSPDTGSEGLSWGISMVHNHDEAYLIRYELIRSE